MHWKNIPKERDDLKRGNINGRIIIRYKVVQI